MKLLNALKGITGEFELNRLVGAFGASSYVIGSNGFVGWNMYLGHPFDVTAYCLAFPAGLGVAVGSIAGAVALKDRQVATAKIISETGAIPVAPPAGPPVDPQKVP